MGVGGTESSGDSEEEEEGGGGGSGQCGFADGRMPFWGLVALVMGVVTAGSL